VTLRLGLVPHDDRPASLDQVERLVRMAGAEVVLPPREALGHRLDPGDATALRRWLLDHRHEADAWVLSLDMLVFGGLVASRTPELDEARATACVDEVWAALADVAPEAVYAYLTLRRLAPTAASGDDVDAWRAGHEAAPDQEARRPNVAAARAAVRGAPGVLALLQEDARPDPALVAEHAALMAEAGPGVVLTPGADEGPRALAARALAERSPAAEIPPSSEPAIQNRIAPEAGEMLAGRGVAVRLSGERGGARVAPYEDRPLGESLAGQLAVAGLVEDAGSAAQLFVWAPDRPGVDLWLGERGEPSSEAEVFLDALREALDAGRRVVVADVADANGADSTLWSRPGAAQLLPRLHGFAAWNTASNTLGCALAQLRLPRDPSGLALRVAEDWGFQSEVRPRATKWARLERQADPWDLADHRGRVESFAEERLRRWWSEAFPLGTWAVRPGHLRLPWSRLFEASIDLEPEGDAP
jgi:hypothetical protein